jgi:zinc transporter, ZIP family
MVCPGLATGIGGLALVAFPKPSERMLDTLLGFTAGVMLAATAFSLLVPSLERGPLVEVVIGFALGCAAIAALDTYLPHAHARFREGGRRSAEEECANHQARLLLSALTIHNIPEGLAVGVAFAAGGNDLGIPIALAIGIQNVPEGFAAAAPLLRTGTTVASAVGVAVLTGLVEPPAALAAYATLDVSAEVVTGGLAFAAGAMLYVVVDELVPESHGHGNERAASLALVVGFALMMTLDNAFG